MPTRRLLGVIAPVALLIASACGGGGGGGGGGIGVKLAEWSVTPDQDTAQAGEVTFDITNDGANVHEFVVFKTDLPADQLPTTEEEGATVVDEEAEGLELIDEVEDISPGASATLTVDLEPGNYVLLCNVPGHYARGMHATFTVS
jgi:uncharacterized cupredoxin-like copper-binding protein